MVAIDGKTLRQSYHPAGDKAAIHMVSAWASANRLVLGQRKVDAKSNEMTAIAQLIKRLELEGCIVTIDAIGCQKQIAKQIIERNADYVLALKDNQGNLFADVQQIFAHAQSRNFADIEHTFDQTVDKGHGRVEIRRCWTMGQVEYLVDADKWEKFTSIGMIQAERRLQGKVERETRYYISSLTSDAARLSQALRSHWFVENALHWVLDLAFVEDIALRRYVRTHFESSINTIARRCQIHSIVVASNSSGQTTNAQSCSSLLFFRADTLSENNSMENRAANTKSHIQPELAFPRSLAHDGKSHCQSQ